VRAVRPAPRTCRPTARSSLAISRPNPPVPTTNARAPATVEHRAIARSFLDRDPRLTDKLLVSHICWQAAYNTGDGYWVANAQAPYAPVLVTTSATDYDDGVISSMQKGRGIGDCVGTATWTWNGHTFVQTSAATTGMCRGFPGGAWELPTLVTRIRK